MINQPSDKIFRKIFVSSFVE